MQQICSMISRIKYICKVYLCNGLLYMLAAVLLISCGKMLYGQWSKKVN